VLFTSVWNADLENSYLKISNLNGMVESLKLRNDEIMLKDKNKDEFYNSNLYKLQNELKNLSSCEAIKTR
jgi:hypothetical protein